MLRLLKNSTFLLFFLGNIASLIGFGFNLIAISWIVLEKTGSEYALGKIMASATAPGLALALFAGVIIDRMNRKWLLVILDIFRMIIIILFLFAISFNDFQLWMLYPVAILMGIGNSLFWPTAQAFVQELVSKEDYFNANKLLSASYQFGSILGAGLGGFIVHIYDPLVALWINVGTYFISGLLITLAPFKSKIVKTKPQKLLNSIKIGFSFLKQRYDILTLGLTTILSDVALWGALSVLTITISKVIFQKGSWGYGLMDGLYGVGALLSAIIVGYLLNMLGRKYYLMICYILAGLMCFIAPIMPNIYFAALAYFVMGINNNAARIIIRTIFMENIPNQIMGRVQTIFGVYTRSMVVLSSLCVGWFIEFNSMPFAIYFTTAHFLIAFFGIVIVHQIWNKKYKILL